MGGTYLGLGCSCFFSGDDLTVYMVVENDIHHGSYPTHSQDIHMKPHLAIGCLEFLCSTLPGLVDQNKPRFGSIRVLISGHPHGLLARGELVLRDWRSPRLHRSLLRGRRRKLGLCRSLADAS